MVYWNHHYFVVWMFLFQFVACQGVLIALVSSHNVADQDMPKSVSMTMLDTIVVGYWSFLMYLSRWEVSFPLEYILVTFTVDSHSILFILTYQPSRRQWLQQNWLFWAFWNKGVLWRTYHMNWYMYEQYGTNDWCYSGHIDSRSKELVRSFQFLLRPEFWVPELRKRCWMLL